jgi:N-methylhydantoinase B/oxoprolinase/acetone carboxylase alpha subunit
MWTWSNSSDSLGRPRNRVMDDLKNGYITPEQAREHYGFRTE